MPLHIVDCSLERPFPSILPVKSPPTYLDPELFYLPPISWIGTLLSFCCVLRTLWYTCVVVYILFHLWLSSYLWALYLSCWTVNHLRAELCLVLFASMVPRKKLNGIKCKWVVSWPWIVYNGTQNIYAWYMVVSKLIRETVKRRYPGAVQTGKHGF